MPPFDLDLSPPDIESILGGGRRRSHPYGVYTPQDEATALEMAKGAAASGMEFLSDILDTFGGRAIKGLLGGKPRELLSVLPFSDTFHLTDETEKVSGEDLAKQWGLDTGNRWADMGVGMGIDLLTDPTSYMFGPGAALTKGGQIAKAAGILPKTVRARQVRTLGGLLDESAPFWRETLAAADSGAASLLPESTLGKVASAAKGSGAELGPALDEALGGLLGFGLPLSRAPVAVTGTGPYARQLANFLGKGTDWLGTTLPFRAARAMFNKDVEGRLSQPLQEGLLRVAPRMQAAKEAGERYGLGIARGLDELGMHAGEGQKTLAKLVTDEASLAAQMGEHTPGMAAKIRGDLARERAGIDASGVGIGEVDQYIPRAKNQFEPTPGFETSMGAPGSLQGISPVSPHLIGRQELFRDIGGTGEVVDQMFMDPRIASPFRTLAEPGRKDLAREADIILREYLGWTPEMTDELGKLQLLKQAAEQRPAMSLAHAGPPDINIPFPQHTPGLVNVPPEAALGLTEEAGKRLAELEKLKSSADEWANVLSRADPKYPALSAKGPTGEAPKPFYDPDVIKGLAQYKTRAEMVKLRAEGIMHAVGKDALPATQAPLDWVPIQEVFQKIGMTGSGAEASLAKMMSSLGNFTGAKLGDLKISRTLARDLENYITPFSRPTALDPFIKTWDTIQAIFKAGVTSIWPKKYIRDAAQGAYMNFTAMTPAEFARYESTAASFIKKGGVIEFANQVPGLEHLSPQQATLKLADEFASLDGFYGGHKSRFAEEAGGAGFTPKELPGKGREGVLEILTPQSERPTTWNPLDIAGVWGREETKYAPVVAGGKISELIDDTNKFALYLQRRMSGYATGAAWEDVLKRHYDFSNLTGFERSVMRRIVPFYSWMKQNIPNTIKRLVDQPGGAEALTAKAVASQRSQEFIPEYVGEGLAIPLSPEDAGQQRFLSRSGLQFEDMLKTIGDIGNIKTLGNLTPALKIPLELATGTQLHTGRPLEDLQSVTGNSVIDELLANSGAPGRAYSIIRPLLMPGKDERGFTADDALKFGVNALAPLSITDVDMARQKQRAIRQTIENQLRGSENVGDVERFYVKPENVGKLTPDQLLLLRTYQHQQDQAQKKRIGVRKQRQSDAGIGYHLD